VIVAEPAPAAASSLAAVIFDVDGTLYDQPRLRRAMATRLLASVIRQPAAGARTIVLSSARKKGVVLGANDLLRVGLFTTPLVLLGAALALSLSFLVVR